MCIARRILLGLLIAAGGAGAAKLLSFPLPWLLGPLLATSATRISGVNSECPRQALNAGQWVIGISVGLYFTPEVIRHVIDHAWLICICVVHAIFLGSLGSWVMRRFVGFDKPSAWFAAAIGGAAEMTVQGERYGAKTDQVATVHSLRVLIVVVFVPFAFQWWIGNDMASTIALPIRNVDFHLGATALFLAGSFLSIWLLGKLRVPNPWVLGTMAFIITLNVMEIHLIPGLPRWVSVIGQIMIGWSLGNRYRSDFLRTAPRLLFVVTFFTLFMLVLSAFVAWMLAKSEGAPLPVMLLGMAPGGIAEMTITAKALGLAVPLVTAMQVIRMIGVVLLTSPIYRITLSWANKQATGISENCK